MAILVKSDILTEEGFNQWVEECCEAFKDTAEVMRQAIQKDNLGLTVSFPLKPNGVFTMEWKVEELI